MICKNCASNISDTAKFCPKCGAKIEAIKPQETKKCPACGSDNPITAKFCKADGHNFQQALEVQSKNFDIERTIQEEITASQANAGIREEAETKPLKTWIKPVVLGSIFIIAGVGVGSYLYFSGLIGKKADVKDLPESLPKATENAVPFKDDSEKIAPVSFNETIDVPDLRGMSLVEANDILISKKLNISVEGEDYDSYTPQGYIMSQDVPPGSKVEEEKTIRIILSKGRPMIKGD